MRTIRRAAPALAAAILLLPSLASAHQERVAPEPRPKIEVAFVLDTTGSMSGLIEGAKQKIWSIANRIARGEPSPELRVGLVGYRDKGDAYVTKRFDLTDNLDAIYDHLRAFKAQGGGDTPEHVGRALGEAVKHFSWSQDKRTLKMIFVVGDAPPQRYGDGWSHTAWAKKAIAKGIMVNTVRCGDYGATATAFLEIARLADGQFISIDASGGMLASATPFDAKIAKVSRAISQTAIYAGAAAERQRATVAKASLDDMVDEAAADRAGFLSAKAKGSGRSYAAEAAAPPSSVAVKDIVAAAPEAVLAYEEDALPAELRGLDKDARVARVRDVKAQRAALEQELEQLTKQRDAHISERDAEREDSFDGAVMKQVRAKAARIGVRYK